MSNQAPDIDITPRDGYAELIGHNFDTVQEAFKVELPGELVERLEEGKQRAIDTHEGQGTIFFFAGMEMQVWAGASQGNKYVLENDDFQIHFGPPARDWPVTVRYLAAGLWEYGFQAVKDRVVKALETECRPASDDLSEWCHISRCDYAFDFYAPDFTKEQFPALISDKMALTSGVKAGMVFTSENVETITIGMNRASLQIQVYDKGKEIEQVSGKRWMYKVYEREGYFPPDDEFGKHIWRVEIRFGKDFLKDRNIRTFEALQDNLQPLLADALMRRRMIQRDGDTNRGRCPLHPMWAAVYEAAGQAGEFLPVGRQITLSREEYREQLEKQMAGLGRSLSVLAHGHYQRGYVERKGADAVDLALNDPEHMNKVFKCVERQRFIDEAR